MKHSHMETHCFDKIMRSTQNTQCKLQSQFLILISSKSNKKLNRHVLLCQLNWIKQHQFSYLTMALCESWQNHSVYYRKKNWTTYSERKQNSADFARNMPW